MATNVQDFLKKNPNYIGYANTGNRSQPKKEDNKPKSKKGSGNQSWLSSIISELGGAGGAVGGAAAGAALGSVVPVLGTAIGGIAGGVLGGFAGGTGGRLVENQVRDNEMRLGDALKEGAVSGAFGGIGPAWQAGRGAYAAGKAAGYGGKGLLSTMKAGSTVLDDAVLMAGKAGGKTGAAKAGMQIMKSGGKTGKVIGNASKNVDELARLMGSVDDLAYAGRKGAQAAGGKLRAVNRGIVSGNSGLSPDDVARQNRALDGVNKWFSGVGKSSQYNNADDAMKALSNTYKASGEGAKKFGANADDVASKFLQNLDDNPLLRNNLTPKYQKVVTSLGDDLSKIKTNGDFVEYMSTKVNPLFRELKNGNPGSVQTQIYEAFRQAGKSVIDEKMATRSGINKQFANLLGATDSLGKTITRDVGAGAGQGLTLGRILGNVAGGAMDIGGRTAQQVGKVTQYTTPVIGGAIARGAVNGGEQPDMNMEQGMEQMPQDFQQLDGGILGPDALYGSQAAMGGQQGLGGAIQGFDQPQAPEQYNPYAPQNLQSSIAQIMQQGGDMGDVKDFLSIATALDKLGGTDEQELTAIQRNKIAGYNTANTVVDSLEQLWQGVSQPGSQLAAGLSGIPGVKQARSTFDPNVRQYTQFAEGTLAPIIKSLGETGVLTDRDIIRAYGLVPNLQDSPDVASNKIQQLRALLTNAEMATAETGGGSQDSLADLLASQQQYAPH
jgi:hypothetical protein